MPTILRFRGFLIGIWFNDHPPAHVHARKGQDFVVFDLNCDGTPVTMRDAHGLKPAEIAAIGRFVQENRDILCKAWRNHYGD